MVLLSRLLSMVILLVSVMFVPICLISKVCAGTGGGRSRYDYYFPAFAMLGEQAILNQEIYSIGTDQAQDGLVFGYQERWAEYRYNPSGLLA